MANPWKNALSRFMDARETRVRKVKACGDSLSLLIGCQRLFRLLAGGEINRSISLLIGGSGKMRGTEQVLPCRAVNWYRVFTTRA
jgi:hypothetical protein